MISVIGQNEDTVFHICLFHFCLSGYVGEHFDAHPNHMKRRSGPYEVEIRDGRSI